MGLRGFASGSPYPKIRKFGKLTANGRIKIYEKTKKKSNDF